MNKIIVFLLITLCNPIYAHEDKITEKTYGNINVYTLTANYSEEINSTLITAQYAELLSNRMDYNGVINLYFFETPFDEETIKSYFNEDNTNDKKGISIILKLKKFDIKGCLNIIEYSILNKNKLKNKKDKLKIYNSVSSNVINSVLEVKIFRPNEVSELQQPNYFTYYYKSDGYHFIDVNDKSEKTILLVSEVFDFFVLKTNLFIVFNNLNEFKIVSSNIKTFKIDEVDDFYQPYKIKLLSENKIAIIYPNLSKFKNRVMLYFIDKNILIQNVESLISN